MSQTKYVWVSDGGKNMCDLCAALDGTEYDSLADVPELHHPNCKCKIRNTETGKLIRPHPWTGLDAPKTKRGDSIYIRPDGVRSVHPAWDSPFNRERFSPAGAARLEKWKKLVTTEQRENMKFSDNAINALKEKENKITLNGRHVIYDDATGKQVSKGRPLPRGATIGYGHLVKKGEDFGNGLTEQQATELYRQDMQSAEMVVKKYVGAPLAQNQYDALVMLVYNIGEGQFRDSTILKYVNNPNTKDDKYKTAEEAWKAFNRDNGRVLQGLINRRDYEWKLYLTGIY